MSSQQTVRTIDADRSAQRFPAYNAAKAKSAESPVDLTDEDIRSIAWVDPQEALRHMKRRDEARQGQVTSATTNEQASALPEGLRVFAQFAAKTFSTVAQLKGLQKFAVRISEHLVATKRRVDAIEKQNKELLATVRALEVGNDDLNRRLRKLGQGAVSSLEANYDGERSLTLMADGTPIKGGTLTLPIPIYRGVFEEGKTYPAGDEVTFAGSVWIAKMTTTAKPDENTPDGKRAWQLCVRRGRDGKSAA
jgi:hypothetical protein